MPQPLEQLEGLAKSPRHVSLTMQRWDNQQEHKVSLVQQSWNNKNFLSSCYKFLQRDNVL